MLTADDFLIGTTNRVVDRSRRLIPPGLLSQRETSVVAALFDGRRVTQIAEDDGVLMGLGQRRGRDEGQLVILDAPTLETVATVTLPQRVPMGFHGNWCPRSQ